MPSRESPRDQSLRRAIGRVDRAIDDIRQARVGAGMSQRALAGRAGISRPRVSRIERKGEPDVPARLLARMAVAVGLDLAIRTYPGAGPTLDDAQRRLLARLRARLGAGWEWQYEVPLPVFDDPRAWDAVATCAATNIVVCIEAETRIEDVQAMLRRQRRKRLDGGASRVVLLVADTRHNREVVGAEPGELRAAFPIGSRHALAALTRGRDPGADALVVL